MKRSHSISLRRLLKRNPIVPLLEAGAALMPGVELALVERNGDVFAGRGRWPGAEIAGYLAAAQEGERIVRAGDLVLCPLVVENDIVGALVAQGEVELPKLGFIQHCFDLIMTQSMERRVLARETLNRYREINLLYHIGANIGSCLDPEEIPELVLGETKGVIEADVGLVLLLSSGQEQDLDVGASFGPADYVESLRRAFILAIARTKGGVREGLERPAILADLPAGATPLGSILYAPLKAQNRVLGAILLGRVETKPIFIAEDRKLLVALAMQAAVAVENAHLFADLKLQRDAIAAMKNYMDDIFASIASGVITTDRQDAVVTLNRAAEHILEVRADEAIGRIFVEGLPGLGCEIVSLVNAVRREGEHVIGYELQPSLPHRGRVVLRLHISPLEGEEEDSTGVAIVVDDLTERRHLEEQVRQVRETFERYVVPHVVEQLLSDPNSVRLGGVRREMTVLFADIRNFSFYSEKRDPEDLVQVLNQHLTLAAEAVLAEEGTLDKFMGDAVMALFNAPLSQPDHALRAVRTALSMQHAIADMHPDLPPDRRLSFGVGITTGVAVVGNVGSATIRNYTAIGDSVNMAQRLQTHAAPGQILLNKPAYELVRQHVVGRELGEVQLKGHSEPDMVFEVLGLRK